VTRSHRIPLPNTIVQPNAYTLAIQVKKRVLVLVGNIIASVMYIYIYIYVLFKRNMGQSESLNPNAKKSNAESNPIVFSTCEQHPTLSSTKQNLSTVLLSPHARKSRTRGQRRGNILDHQCTIALRCFLQLCKCGGESSRWNGLHV
jgi:hypothetical protein